MPRTLIVLAALPTMLADIVRQALAPHPDLEIVAQVSARAELLRVLASTPASVAIVGLAVGESPLDCSDLLRAHPHLAVVAITDDGRSAYRCEMRVQLSVVTELSARGLVAAIRPSEDVDPDLHLFSLHRSISAPDRTPDN